jgi:quercetin dioxygenase-like cupin family protein
VGLRLAPRQTQPAVIDFEAGKRMEVEVQNGVVDWSALEPTEVIPGFHGRFAHSANMTFVMWVIEAGAILPEHSHLHEQVVHMLEGDLEVTIDGDTCVLHAGSLGIIPPNAVHSARALTACRVMDAFYPLRDDYMQGGGTSVLKMALKGSG